MGWEYIYIFNYFIFINNFNNFGSYVYIVKKLVLLTLKNPRTSNIMEFLCEKI